MRRAISIRAKFVTLVFVLPMLTLITSNATMSAAEDVTSTLEKRVQKINTEINALKSQWSRVNGQLTESTIIGMWL